MRRALKDDGELRRKMISSQRSSLTLNPMFRFLQLFARLCLFRGQAADVPRSEALLVITGAVAVISNAVNAVPNMGLFGGAFLSVGQVLLFSAFIYLILRFRGRQERAIQTLTAMFGASSILQIIALPFFGWHERLLPDDPEAAMMLTTPLIVAAIIAVWSLAVMTSILRQAMETGTGAALLMIVGCQSLVMFIIMSLSSNPTG